MHNQAAWEVVRVCRLQETMPNAGRKITTGIDGLEYSGGDGREAGGELIPIVPYIDWRLLQVIPGGIGVCVCPCPQSFHKDGHNTKKTSQLLLSRCATLEGNGYTYSIRD